MDVKQFLYSYIAKEEYYEDQEHIIDEGRRGDWLYVVLEGQVKVKKMTPKGVLTLDTLQKGEIFGEVSLWLAGKGVRTASVVAEGPAKVGILDTDQLLKDYESISPRLKSLMKSLIMRFADTTKKAAILSVET
ncbi:MAG: cyclic nucleotide-binding domain-containing protein [Deltaproteobacteria bacterium]|nr:cyclic nucleotide-binding domain-containing protein [Deltaproteobacteria bacterium]